MTNKTQKVSTRLMRCEQIFRDIRTLRFSDMSCLTLAFDAIYLCCLDALSLDGAAFDAIEHPVQLVVDEGARVLQLADGDVADAQRLLTWCLTLCEHGPEWPLESGTAKDAVALAERVLACAVDFIAKNHD